MNLEGKVALVTGGARRVGRAVALALGRAGCDVAITRHRSQADAEGVAAALRELGRRAWVIEADLSDPSCAEHIRDRLLGEAGRVDVLVHNASEFIPTPFGDIDEDQWSRQSSVNTLAPLLLTQALREPLAADEGGRVIHLVDIHAMGRPRRGYSVYLSTKAALIELTYTLALELAPKVTVNAVAPGVVAWAQGMGEGERDAYLARVPLQRAGTPQDAAAAVLFLARDADYITGQVIRVDGGRWLS